MKKNDKVIVNIDDKNANIKKFHMKYKSVFDLFLNLSYDVRNKTNNSLNVDEKKNVFYPFIPLSLATLTNSITGLIKYLNIKPLSERPSELNFLDAGCGIGNILYYVRKLIDVPCYWAKNKIYHGLELDNKLIKLGRTIFSLPPENSNNSYPTKIFNKDIIKFKGYKKYNIIYYFCPIDLTPLQMLFEERLEDLVNPGTIIIPNTKRSDILNSFDDRFKPIEIEKRGSESTILFEKINNGKRKYTNISSNWKTSIPERYRKIYNTHIDKYDFRKVK